MRDKDETVYVVQYSDELGAWIALGGIYSILEDAINEVEKNDYTYINHGENNGVITILFESGEGERYQSGFAEIVERKLVDKVYAFSMS